MKNTLRKLMNTMTTIAITISSLSSLSVLAVSAEETDNLVAKMTISNVEAYPGSQVTVSLNIEENPGITAFGVLIEYDERLTVKSSQKTSLMDMLAVATKENMLSIGAAAPYKTFKNGSFFDIVFEIPEDAEVGSKYFIKWLKLNDLTSDGLEVDSTVFDGSITIIEKEKEELNKSLGDINDDGYVNTIDAIMILNIYVDTMFGIIPNYTVEQLSRADVNSDGLIDSRDARLTLGYYSQRMFNNDLTWADFL